MRIRVMGRAFCSLRGIRLLLRAGLLVLTCAVPRVSWAAERLPFEALFAGASHAMERDASGRGGKLQRVLIAHGRHKPAVWDADLAAVAALPPAERLRAVQEVVNRRILYQDDPENVWKAPDAAYRTGGDCEDYAVAKLLLLEESGFPAQELRVVTLAPMAAAGGIYHVVLLARWQDKIYVLDSPNRTPGSGVVSVERYRDAARPVDWAAWSRGVVPTPRSPEGSGGGEVLPVRGYAPYGPLRMPSYRQFPANEKLVRIAADLLVIRPGEPKLTPDEVTRLRRLRDYFHDPNPDTGEGLSAFERRKLDDFRAMRKAL